MHAFFPPGVTILIYFIRPYVSIPATYYYRSKYMRFVEIHAVTEKEDVTYGRMHKRKRKIYIHIKILRARTYHLQPLVVAENPPSAKINIPPPLY